jgi:hypothetical protein
MSDNSTSPSLDSFLRGRTTKSENTTPDSTINIIEQTIRTKDSPGYKELQGVMKILSRATTPIKNSSLDFPFSLTAPPSTKLSSSAEIFEKLICIEQKLDYVTKTLLKIEKNHLKIHLHNHNE